MFGRILIFCIYTFVCLLGLRDGLRRRRELFAFPFLSSISTIVFILPQVSTCLWDEYVVPDDAFYISMIYGIFCQILGLAGYYSYRTPPLVNRPKLLHPERIMHIGVLLILIGIGAFVALDIVVFKEPFGLFAKEGHYSIEWEGVPVALMSITRFIYPGIIMFLFGMLALKRRTVTQYIVVSVAMFYPILTLVLLGRRSAMMLIAGSLILPLFYVKKWTPNRMLTFGGAIVVGVAVILLPVYRPYFAYDADHGEILKIDPVEAVLDSFGGDTNLELPYQMHTVGAIFHTGQYGWGVDFYNTLVKAFLPALFVGKERKEVWYLPGAQPEEAVLQTYGRGHIGLYYLAEQGIIDSFWQFSFGGALLFWFLGVGMKHLSDRALRDRSMTWCLFACLLSWMTPLIIYGGFLQGWRNLVLVLPFYWFTRWYATVREQQPVIAKRASTTSKLPARIAGQTAVRRPLPVFARNGNGNGQHKNGQNGRTRGPMGRNRGIRR
jgi:hypothetical protein